MKKPWQQIDSTEKAEWVSGSVCWEDSSLRDSIFCSTSFVTESGSIVSGVGLRALVECCSGHGSHLELCFVDIEEPVAMPLKLSNFVGTVLDTGSLRFGLSYGELSHKCKAGYFRFLDIDYRDAGLLYQSPTVLAAGEGKLDFDGAVDCSTADGGYLVLSGDSRSPKLYVMRADGQECEVFLDRDAAAFLLDNLHSTATS